MVLSSAVVPPLLILVAVNLRGWNTESSASCYLAMLSHGLRDMLSGVVHLHNHCRSIASALGTVFPWVESSSKKFYLVGALWSASICVESVLSSIKYDENAAEGVSKTETKREKTVVLIVKHVASYVVTWQKRSMMSCCHQSSKCPIKSCRTQMYAL